MRAGALQHGAPRRVAGRAHGQAVEVHLGAAQGRERRAEGPQRRWSTAEAPKRPYAGGIGGRRVARPATTSMARESLGCSFLFHLRRFKNA
jgi:hypothetical protein